MAPKAAVCFFCCFICLFYRSIEIWTLLSATIWLNVLWPCTRRKTVWSTARGACCRWTLDSLKFPARNKARRMGDSRSTSTMLLTETTVALEALLTRAYWTSASKHFADMLLKFWLFWLRCDWSSMLLWFLVKQRQIPLMAIFYLGKTRKDWMIREILLTN